MLNAEGGRVSETKKEEEEKVSVSVLCAIDGGMRRFSDRLSADD